MTMRYIVAVLLAASALGMIQLAWGHWPLFKRNPDNFLEIAIYCCVMGAGSIAMAATAIFLVLP